jgi:hypothetical protein
VSDPADPPLPERRASDSDRERAVDTLRHAAADGQLTVDELEERVTAAYAARTRRDLERLLADLTPAQGVQAGGLMVKEGPGGERWVISVMGGHERAGRWRLAPRCTVVSFMGGTDIDLNDAELAERATQLNVYSFMGGIEVRVPHGVEVRVTNVAIMGGNDVKLGDEVAPAGGPTIHIRLVSIMGGISVQRGRKLTRREKRELREAKRRELER